MLMILKKLLCHCQKWMRKVWERNWKKQNKINNNTQRDREWILKFKGAQVEIVTNFLRLIDPFYEIFFLKTKIKKENFKRKSYVIPRFIRDFRKLLNEKENVFSSQHPSLSHITYTLNVFDYFIHLVFKIYHHKSKRNVAFINSSIIINIIVVVKR